MVFTNEIEQLGSNTMLSHGSFKNSLLKKLQMAGVAQHVKDRPSADANNSRHF